MYYSSKTGQQVVTLECLLQKTRRKVHGRSVFLQPEGGGPRVECRVHFDKKRIMSLSEYAAEKNPTLEARAGSATSSSVMVIETAEDRAARRASGLLTVP